MRHNYLVVNLNGFPMGTYFSCVPGKGMKGGVKGASDIRNIKYKWLLSSWADSVRFSSTET